MIFFFCLTQKKCLNEFFRSVFFFCSILMIFWCFFFLPLVHSLNQLNSHSKIQFFAHTQQNDVYSFPRVAPNCKFRKNFTVDAGVRDAKSIALLTNIPNWHQYTHATSHLPMENGYVGSSNIHSVPKARSSVFFTRCAFECVRASALVLVTREHCYARSVTITCTVLRVCWCLSTASPRSSVSAIHICPKRNWLLLAFGKFPIFSSEILNCLCNFFNKLKILFIFGKNWKLSKTIQNRSILENRVKGARCFFFSFHIEIWLLLSFRNGIVSETMDVCCVCASCDESDESERASEWVSIECRWTVWTCVSRAPKTISTPTNR